MILKKLCLISLCLLISGCGFEPSRSPGLSIQAGDLNPHIVSGIEVTKSDALAKHSVLIHYYEKEGLGAPRPSRYTVCSGVIVSNKSVLTAAHCFDSPPSSKMKFIDIYFTVDSANLEKVEKIQAIKFATHPHYVKDQAIHFDLAILTLSQAVPKGFGPIEMLPPTIELKPGMTVVPAGYGRTDESKESEFKLHKSKGLKILEDWGTYLIVDQRAGSGICAGDSGGPTFIQFNDKWFLAGVNTAVYSEDDEVLSCQNKSTMVKIQTHKNWILKNLSE